jgi:hypothetical protein
MPASPQPQPALPPATLALLRLEGLAVAAGSALFYARSGASWWFFALLWITPDLSMLGYYAGPRWGARCYNAVHTYLGPAALAGFALAAHHESLMPWALVWFNHIGVDRLLGYGLKSPQTFGQTHLSPTRPITGN